ncbi:MAG TPA: CPXCG motif-containing cysteine-rich protein [Gemmatimonadales bacterium]
MEARRSDASDRIGELGNRCYPGGQEKDGQPDREGQAGDSSTFGGAMSLGDDELDEAFPLGDGTAETSATVFCPYCGEINEIGLDPGSGTEQEYVEDCQVCCRAWQVRVHYLPDGSADVAVQPEDLG